jgi:hypothetical protein
MTDENPEELADDLEQEARTMERRTERVSDQLARIRQDWERKRADPNVPGAPAPAEDAGSQDAAASERPESAGPEAPPPDAHPAEAEGPSEREAPSERDD